ncbi:MAG: DUF2157 domain-containing protein [Cyclobacteriaceae bacterium]|jgi:hypothetical protein
MTPSQLEDLRQRNLISPEQYDHIEPILSGKIVSVFYELRTLLYLGILLFSTGAGILIYQNIGELGHILALTALIGLMLACFAYITLKRPPYSHAAVKPPTPYYDYIVLLGCLLLVSVLGYAQYQFNLLEGNLEWATLTTALIFFAVAYRFDHVGILSMAITAFVSFWGIRLSIANWAGGDFFTSRELYITALVLGVALSAIGSWLDTRQIKTHFTFTYQNFGLLLWFAGCFVGMAASDIPYGWFVLLIYAGCAVAYFTARWKKSFLFLLYAFLAAYIATTVWLADLIFDQHEMLWFLYSIASCGALIYFVVKYRNHFRQ